MRSTIIEDATLMKNPVQELSSVTPRYFIEVGCSSAGVKQLTVVKNSATLHGYANLQIVDVPVNLTSRRIIHANKFTR